MTLGRPLNSFTLWLLYLQNSRDEQPPCWLLSCRDAKGDDAFRGPHTLEALYEWKDPSLHKPPGHSCTSSIPFSVLSLALKLSETVKPSYHILALEKQVFYSSEWNGLWWCVLDLGLEYVSPLRRSWVPPHHKAANSILGQGSVGVSQTTTCTPINSSL